jgi:hypothetical protein
MDEKEIDFFIKMETTFDTPGWELMTQGWTTERDSLYENVFFNAKSIEEVNNARVRFGILNELIELPNTIRKQKDELINMDPDNG